ncbi:hypothetical protein Tco_1045063 [Tanacetum coccineum]|uniref:Uncharacterized protein n=1 Tax=Tanacetum coccineum TaxID=301880 RepID=A0ABQ5GU76_9ASTR
MASQDARLSKFEADFKQQQNEMTNKIDTVLKAIPDQIAGTLPNNTVKNPKLRTHLVSSARSYPTIDPQCSSYPSNSINVIKAHFKEATISQTSLRMAKIAVGEGITRLVFYVKGADLDEEEVPYWTIIGKRESYKPRPSLNGVGAQTPYYARKDFLECHFPGEWEISRDAEINPFKDTLVFRRMVIFDEKKLGSS